MKCEYYPTLSEMAPWNKRYPVTRLDGWNVFHGPHIGSLAPDGYVVARSNEPKTSLHRIIEAHCSVPMQYCVLIFDGISHGNTTTTSHQIATTINKRYSTIARSCVITRYYEDTTYDIINTILGDIDLTLEKKYGATGQSIYVVDTTKVIVWKSCGLMIDRLYDRLDTKTK